MLTIVIKPLHWSLTGMTGATRADRAAPVESAQLIGTGTSFFFVTVSGAHFSLVETGITGAKRAAPAEPLQSGAHFAALPPFLHSSLDAAGLQGSVWATGIIGSARDAVAVRAAHPPIWKTGP
jgi:hypothetical protein